MEVSRVVHISNRDIALDGVSVVEGDDILRAGYQHLQMAYPKFYKMDMLAQAGVIGTEYLLRSLDLSKYGDDRLAVVMNTREGSAVSDMKHHQLTETGTVSPAVFVYTLPNIVLGEIAIRHSLFGEQICTVSDGPDSGLLLHICNATVERDKADAIVLMQLDALGDYLNCTFVLLEKESGADSKNELSVELLKKILTDG